MGPFFIAMLVYQRMTSGQIVLLYNSRILGRFPYFSPPFGVTNLPVSRYNLPGSMVMEHPHFQ